MGGIDSFFSLLLLLLLANESGVEKVENTGPVVGTVGGTTGFGATDVRRIDFPEGFLRIVAVPDWMSLVTADKCQIIIYRNFTR